MGTRSTTKFYRKLSNGIMVYFGGIYRQYDGYPEGHGRDLVELLKGKTFVNGFNSSQKTNKFFNGIECLGAWIIGQLKGEDIGNIYLTSENSSEEYNYKIYQDETKPTIYISIGDFDGTIEEFNKWIDQIDRHLH